MEREAMEQINKNLGEIRSEYYKNKDFIGRGFKTPPEFMLKGYDDDPTPTARPTPLKPPEEPQTGASESTPDQPTEKTTAEPGSSQPEAPGTPEQAEQPPATEQKPAKAPRMLARLKDELNGSIWNVGPLTRRTRYVAHLINCFNEPGDLEATVYNTEIVPDDEPNQVQEDPEAPEQEAIVNGDI